MTLMRAGDEARAIREAMNAAPLALTVRAGACVTIRVGAVDRQSGVGEIVARCRACDNRDLFGVGRILVDAGRRPPSDHAYAVSVPIPERAPTGVWEVHRIVLSDRDGNRRTYACGRDFAPILFQVVSRDGIDCTPPRLLGVQVAAGD